MTSVSMRDDEFPKLDPNKVRDVDDIIAGFRNLSYAHGYANNHSQIIFIYQKHWLLGGALIATLTVSSVNDSIKIDTTLNAERSDQLQQEGFSRREIGCVEPLSVISFPHGFPIFYNMYDNHQASFQGGVGFLEKLDKTLGLIGGKRRPEALNHRRFHL